ncbi:hypothetical protein EJ110_NYTH54396 [Nymphaea thermarum]|nr:hypothetical protein EJ110_NYTH54396 [Nymphaea thermarum]
MSLTKRYVLKLFFSLKYITANVVDRNNGRIVSSASSVEAALKHGFECNRTCNAKAAAVVGEVAVKFRPCSSALSVLFNLPARHCSPLPLDTVHRSRPTNVSGASVAFSIIVRRLTPPPVLPLVAAVLSVSHCPSVRRLTPLLQPVPPGDAASATRHQLRPATLPLPLVLSCRLRCLRRPLHLPHIARRSALA